MLIWIVLGIGAYSGYRQGLFISILSIVAFIVGLILAFHLMDRGAHFLAQHVSELTFMLPFLAFLMIFLGIVVSIRLLAYLVKKTLDFTILGPVDNVAGAFLGIVKTAFVLSLFLWIADSFEFKITQNWTEKSKTTSIIRPMAPVVIGFLDAYTPIISESVKSIQSMVKFSADGIAD